LLQCFENLIADVANSGKEFVAFVAVIESYSGDGVGAQLAKPHASPGLSISPIFLHATNGLS